MVITVLAEAFVSALVVRKADVTNMFSAVTAYVIGAQVLGAQVVVVTINARRNATAASHDLATRFRAVVRATLAKPFLAFVALPPGTGAVVVVVASAIVIVAFVCPCATELAARLGARVAGTPPNLANASVLRTVDDATTVALGVVLVLDTRQAHEIPLAVSAESALHIVSTGVWVSKRA